MTDEEHNKYIALAFIGHGAVQILFLSLVFVFLSFVLFDSPDENFPKGLVAGIFGTVGFVNLILLSPNFIAAYALIKRKPWARVMSIIASALAVMSVPTGTLAGVYALWFFVGDRWRSVYEPIGLQNAGLSLNSGTPDPRWEGRFVNESGEEVFRQPEIPDWR